jgi:hypothetical protein
MSIQTVRILIENIHLPLYGFHHPRARRPKTVVFWNPAAGAIPKSETSHLPELLFACLDVHVHDDIHIHHFIHKIHHPIHMIH